MRNEFLRTMLTPAVQAEQVRAYGRSRVPASGQISLTLGAEEAAFIAARDSFYFSSVNEDGWPYVQHRGGPAGFVRVTSPTELVFGDYTGNRQLITTGNVRARRRVALFFMDYPARERLKVLGHAEVLQPEDDPSLTASLAVPSGTQLERLFRVNVTAFDWNCPKYITPRFTLAEVQVAVAPLKERIADLEAQLAQFRSRNPQS